MICPVCGGELTSAERQGIELDYCSECRGIWLDQGELNELIQREAVAAITRGQEALSAARRDKEFDLLLSEARPALLLSVG